MESQNLNELLSNLYYSLDSSVSYSGREKLFKEAKKRNGKIKRNDVNKWLQSQLPYTLHRSVRLNFKTRRVVVYDIDEQWQMDLVDLPKISTQNDGHRYILVAIDVFSKYAWVESVKNKSGPVIKKAFQNILESNGKRKPKFIQTDKGNEFFNQHMRGLLQKNNIKLFTTNSERKASIVERFNRTLKELMFKYFTKNNTRRYIDVLHQFVGKYNNSYHRSIKMKPREVTEENSSIVWLNLYEKDWKIRNVKSKKFRVGNKVRISSEKTTFQKRYEEIWTEEIFTITHVIKGNPIVYKVEDDSGESIKGTFYEKELQKVTPPETYRIEKVIRKKKNKDGSVLCLVKWKGYPDKFNSYVLEEDLQRL